MYNSQPEERLEGWYPHILVIYHISWGMPEFQPCDSLQTIYSFL